VSFLYPRTVSVVRPSNTITPGNAGYASVNGVQGTTILAGVSCSIQLDRQGQRNPVGLPTDAAFKPIWKVFIPRAAVSEGQIVVDDMVIDDLGVNYQVFAPYWNSLGYQLRCIVLEP
jgi:hypothetical protein